MYRKVRVWLAAVVYFLLLTEIIAISEGRLRNCQNQLDCYENECCVQKGTFVYCKHLSKKGSRCSTKPNYNHTIHLLNCPCTSSYRCENDSYKSKCTPYEDLY